MPTDLEKFSEWKKKFSHYEGSGLLDWIKDVAIGIARDEFIYSDKKDISDEGRKYLSDHFSINTATKPSTVDFLVYSFLSEVMGVDDAKLTSIKNKIGDTASIELTLLYNLFSLQELKPHVDKLSQILTSLVDKKKLQEAAQCELEIAVKEDEFILNQIAFCFAAPLHANISASDDDDETKQMMRDNLQMLYHEMVRHESNATPIIDALLHDPAKLPEVISAFFDKLKSDIVSRGEIDIPLPHLDVACEGMKNLFLRYYREEGVEKFLPFKPRFVEELSAEELAIIDREVDCDQPSKRAIAVLQKATGDNFKNLFKVSCELLHLYKKQDFLPETANLNEKMAIVDFTSTLLRERYQINWSEKFVTGDWRLDEIFGFVMQSFVGASAKYVMPLNDQLDLLRSEIRTLKTGRDLTQKAQEYFDPESGLNKRVTDVTNAFLVPLKELVKDFPQALIEHDGVLFRIKYEIDSLVAKSLSISSSFTEKFNEIKEEVERREKTLLEAEIAKQKELEEERKEYERAKREVRQVQPQYEIKCAQKDLKNKQIIPIAKTFKGDKGFSDAAYNIDNYVVYMTDDVYNLLATSDKRIADAVNVAIDSGFLHAKSRGDTGIKPMDHGQDYQGCKIVELKLTGHAIINNFLNASSTGMGDIRLCGVLKDDVLLLTHATLHGENNADLRQTAAEIYSLITNGSISIESPKSKPKSNVTAKSGVNAANSGQQR